MKRKIGIVTINDNDNYGNRLQNYATNQIIEKLGDIPITIKNSPRLNKREKPIKYFKKFLGYIYHEKLKCFNIKNKNRKRCFNNFNNNITFTNKTYSIYSKIGTKFEYFIVGSDQVWKPTYGRLGDFDLLDFDNAKNKISFSASFGINELPEQYHNKTAKALKEFKAISVREDAGKDIIEKLTGRKDIQVLVDPTMLLTAEQWDRVSKKPERLKTNKYILNYFLGELSEERKNEINRIAKENNCEVINILDKKSPFYETGPSEFLYLEKNAFLICTDSFHSSVFAILYNRPFIVFTREDNKVNMNSRIETLINKFNLKNREFTGTITKENLEQDYTEAYEILENERNKSIKFLKEALDIKD